MFQWVIQEIAWNGLDGTASSNLDEVSLASYKFDSGCDTGVFTENSTVKGVVHIIVSFLSSEILVLLLTSGHFFKLTDNPKRTPLREVSDLPLRVATMAILSAFFIN